MTQCYCTGDCKGGTCPNAIKSKPLTIHFECLETLKKISDRDQQALTEAAQKWKEWKQQDPECLWESLPQEERNKPQMLSCPCKKCSPWSC